MAIDLAKIKSRLEAFNKTSTKTSFLWKPTGKSVVRIVPYSHNPSDPFIELKFHYGLNGKTFLSPSTFGRPDPIVELATKLIKESRECGDKDEATKLWKQGRKHEPKSRTYVPVIVRGEEDKGVRFWGMGKTVYEQLLGLIADEDYGDITDLKNGRDITVEFKDAAAAGKEFPETTVRPKANASPAFDVTNKVLLEKVKNQRNILELFPEPSYETLETEFYKSVNADTDDASVPEIPADDSVETSSAQGEKPAVSETLKNKAINPPSTQSVADEFENLFGEEA